MESVGDIENGSKDDSTLKRRIKFQLATKQYSGFKNNTSDFKIETLNPGYNSRKRPFSFEHHHPGQSGKKVDGSDFVENGLDPELCFGISFRKIGAGLENLGNTCFLNSVVQCLTYTEPLAAYLQSGKHQNSCHVAGFCALCAIQKHVSRALQSSGRSLVPKDLVSNLRCISRNFRNARQEDAHEYMVNLLESMHKCCLPSGVASESPAALEKSLVHKIFGGHLRSQVECQQCSYCSNKFDPFLDLSLEIARADSLPVALRNFTAAEMLDGGEKQYQCQRCKQKVRAKKRLTVHKAPHVLTIHLKRFHAHDPGRKVDKKVIFDRSLDIKPFVSGSYEEDLKYSLYGVLVHYGHNTHSGHYVCFVRTSSNMWHLLNDNQVRQVSEKTVLEQKAYMLFYVRDRKNVVARKPVDVVKKESMKATLGSNFANLVAKQFSKEHMDNEIYPKEALFQQNNRQKLLKVHPALETSRVPLAFPNETSQKINVGLNVGVSSQVPCSDFCDKTSGEVPRSAPSVGSTDQTFAKTVTVKSPNKSSCESNQCGDIPSKSGAGKTPCDKAGKGGQQIAHQSVEESIPSVIQNECSRSKAPDCTPKKRLKKKLLKCRMHLGSSFFKASLGVHMRKKHKRRKLGPSTSKISTVILASMTSRRKAKSGSIKENDTRKSSYPGMGVVDGESMERNILSGALLAMDKQRQNSSTSISEVNGGDAREPDCTENSKRDVSQNGIMNIPSGGVKVTVAPWDGIELPPQIVESNAVENLSIGYVANEWDEEYDRGKRKKLRQSQHTFDGPNLFPSTGYEANSS
ncbi:UBIQUITIN CARBOXYL-TERMINAL HYDROLASE [Salix purpurea]|uniref:Ubiquitin carboxyl-terminal hydrolase n=1 Tax=Salix purpurea TaxID=77065 RepID=A0A9Q0UKC6_SALPP|nr:UBIQUITIN CARBOXYL-TERMINAL HYDROLASE [Salix purpurea]